MTLLAEHGIDNDSRARVGRLLTRYRVFIFMALLALACSLAYADRRHDHPSPPRLTQEQVNTTD